MSGWLGPHDEVQAEPMVRSRPEERSVHRELARLHELLDLVERSIVGLGDTKTVMQDRLAPILSPAPSSIALDAAWPDREPPNCAVAENLALHCRRLENLVDMLGGADRSLRDLADRVEV